MIRPESPAGGAAACPGRGSVAPWLLALCLLPIYSPAQNSDTSRTSDPAIEAEATTPRLESTERLEEITVVGEQSIVAIRFQIERAEDSLYSLFNELNSSDDFDIVCRNIRITNSNIPRRQCEPVFFTNLRRNSAQFAQSELRQAWSEEGIDPAVLDRAMAFIETDDEMQEQAAGKFEELQEEMLRIALENPQYLEALQQLGQLKAQLEQQRQRRFGKPVAE